MKERDYIVASELRSVRIAKDIIRVLIAVDNDEQRDVMVTLRKWERKFEREAQ